MLCVCIDEHVFMRSIFSGVHASWSPVLPLTTVWATPLLNHAFTAAIKLLQHEHDPLVPRISLELDDAKAVALAASIGAGERTPTQLLEAFDCITMSYRIEWPLDLILTSSNMAQYNSVLRFFLKVKLVAFELADLWSIFQQTSAFIMRRATSRVRASAKAAPSVSTVSASDVASLRRLQDVWVMRLRQLQLYRHEFYHFVTVLQGYLITQVLDVSWAELQDQLGNARSWLDLRDVHQQYVSLPPS